MKHCDVLIIGGGASGLAAALEAARTGAGVTVLERLDAPAKKIFATGNGRCNYSNVMADGSADLVRFFSDELGIEPVEEEGRLYPRSMSQTLMKVSSELR